MEQEIYADIKNEDVEKLKAKNNESFNAISREVTDSVCRCRHEQKTIDTILQRYKERRYPSTYISVVK